MRGAFAAVVIASPDYAASPSSAYEWASALALGVPVTPVIVRDADLHPRLAEQAPLVFGDATGEAVLARLAQIVAAGAALNVQVPPGAPDAVHEAVAALNHPEPARHEAAITALAASHHPAARAALRAALQHPVFPGVRRLAIHALARARDDETIRALLDALGDADRDTAREAAEALGKIGRAAIPGLVEALRSDRRDVRRGAAWALALTRDPASVPGLIEALQIRDWTISRTAAVALGRLGDPRAVPDLTAALDSDDSHLRDVAAAALAAIGQ